MSLQDGINWFCIIAISGVVGALVETMLMLKKARRDLLTVEARSYMLEGMVGACLDEIRRQNRSTLRVVYGDDEPEIEAE